MWETSRVMLDKSLTFGGFHFSNPREIFVELRYRFHYWKERGNH